LRERTVLPLSLTLLVFVTSCASLPTDYPQPVPSFALEPDPATRLGRLETRYTDHHGEGVSGFEPIDANGDGLWWRLALVDSAERSLDIQYYLWYGDDGGLILLHHVLAAAERGVRVRILVDDFLFMTDKRGLANLEGHPNLEIRIFNPWAEKGAAAGPEYIARFDRLNHRMHNKLLIADCQMAILGGRNVGDHYFGLSEDYNFHDLDLITIGNASRQSTEIFDHFWNSDAVIPASAFVDEVPTTDFNALSEHYLDRLRTSERLGRYPIDARGWKTELENLVDRMSPGTATVGFDRVLPGTRIPTQDGFEALAAITDGALREILVANAYIIPDDEMMEAVRKTSARGVRFRVLTNSLASQDVPAVNSKYKKYRVPLIEAGVELYEFDENPAIQHTIVDDPPTRSTFSALHTKAMVVDRKHVYVGSLNLDPRSIKINTEMGMIVTSPSFAEKVARIIERDMEPVNSWRVTIDEGGELVWESDEGIVHRQPARGAWQRIQGWFLGLTPKDQL